MEIRNGSEKNKKSPRKTIPLKKKNKNSPQRPPIDEIEDGEICDFLDNPRPTKKINFDALSCEKKITQPIYQIIPQPCIPIQVIPNRNPFMSPCLEVSGRNTNLSPTPLEEALHAIPLPEKQKNFLLDRYRRDVLGKCDHRAAIWMNNIVRIPFEKTITYTNRPIGDLLQKVKNNLDEQFYGLTQIKEHILIMLNNKLRNPELNQISTIVGPSGVGKTAIIRSVLNSLEIPFYQMPICDIEDPSFFTGIDHQRQCGHVGAFVSALQSMKCMNGIIFMDGIDHISPNRGKHVYEILHKIFYYSQNNKFYDNYIGTNIPIDLSRVWFVFAINDICRIPPLIQENLFWIQMSSYTEEETFQITKILLDRVIKNLKYKSSDILMPDETIKYLISLTGKEHGLKDINKFINTLFTRININLTLAERDIKLGLSIEIKNFKLPFTITNELIYSLLIQ